MFDILIPVINRGENVMGAKENKTTQPEKTELIKSISSLLDETIAEVEKMAKGDVSFKDLKLQPDENGDMPKEAGSGSDQFKSMKKEDEDDMYDKMSDDDKKKYKHKKKGKDMDYEEEAKKSDEEIDPEYEEFKGKLSKALIEFGLLELDDSEESVTKSEEEDDSEDLEKSDEDGEGDELAKALESRDAEVKQLKQQIQGLTETVEKISRIPQGRRSLSGLKPIMKSENDANGDGGSEQPLNKGEVLDKLIDMQRSGDKRVTPQLVAKYELSGDQRLVQEILTGK